MYDDKTFKIIVFALFQHYVYQLKEKCIKKKFDHNATFNKYSFSMAVVEIKSFTIENYFDSMFVVEREKNKKVDSFY